MIGRMGISTRFWLVAAAGVCMVSSFAVGADEVVVEATSPTSLNVRAKNEKGVMAVGVYQIDKDTTVDLDGKTIAVNQLQKGWKITIESKKPEKAGKDSKIKIATKIKVLCEWMEGTLSGKPTDSAATIQTKLGEKNVNLRVLFLPNIEYKNMDGKKAKELAKGTKVEVNVISGSFPPVALVFQIAAPPTPEPLPTPTPTPIPVGIPAAVPTPTLKATVPPTAQPTVGQPTSQPAASQPASKPAASQPAGK